MLRRLSSIAARGDRAERLIASAAIPRGFASSAASGGWWGRGTSSTDDDGSNSTSTSGSGDETSAAWTSQTMAQSDVSALHDAASASGFDPVGLTAAALEAAHATSGLPWWATVACGAVAVRAALFPFTVKQAKAGALLNTAIARARDRDGKPPRDVRSVLAAASELRRATDGVSLGWLIGGPLIQLPTFVLAVMSVRRLVADDAVAAKGLETGGILWFSDLTQVAVHVDTATAPMGVHGAILPVAVAGALFANINNAWGGAAEKSKPALAIKLFMEWLTVPTLLIGLTLPQAVHVYWLPASLTALAQGAIMRTGAARKALGIDPKFARASAERDAVLDVAAPRRNDEIASFHEKNDEGEDEGSVYNRPAITFERDLESYEAEALREAAEALAAEKAEDAERILARAAAEPPRADAEPIGEPKTIGGSSDDTSVGVSKKLASSSPLSAAAHPAVLFALGQTRAKLKLWRGAAAAYDACAAGEADVERRGRALAGAGVATANAGDSLGATARLEAALKIRPRDVSCLISLAAVRKKQGDVREALAVLERAAEIAPEVRARFIEPLERETSRIRETERATKRRDKNAQKRGKGKRR
jgi:YidC/Oxa1 family membrane protein insertase